MSNLFVTDMDIDVTYISFNQNYTSLVVVNRFGYDLYSLESLDAINKCYSCRASGVHFIERLFDSALLAIVDTERTKLMIWNLKTESAIREYYFSEIILSIKLNRERFIVCFETCIYIYSMQDLNMVYTINTVGNINGLYALSSSADHCYLAYPESATTGKIQIFHVIDLCKVIVIAAHATPLTALAFSVEGTEIATASERGTKIRIFSTVNGNKLFEFLRGYKRSVSISSLSFSTCGEYVASSSNTETIHIFHLNRTAIDSQNSNQRSDESTSFSLWNLGKAFSNYLPAVTDVLSQSRSFASVFLPKSRRNRVCAITRIKKELRLLVTSDDGILYVFAIPSVAGEECQLVRRHDLLFDEYYPGSLKDMPSTSTGSSVNTSLRGNISSLSNCSSATTKAEKENKAT